MRTLMPSVIQSVVQPLNGSYDPSEYKLEAAIDGEFSDDLYDVHDDFNDIALYVTRAGDTQDE